LQIILNEESDTILKEMKEKRYMPYATTVKRALKVFKYALDAQDEGGGFAIIDKNGKVISTPRIL
jgi:hypothetical protein